jgi:hypothetical protein
MSTPEPNTTTPANLGVPPRTTDGVIVPRSAVYGPTRTTRACRWVGYHLGELVAVTTPAVLAVTVSPWWAIGTGAAGALWGVHEYRAHRGQAGGDR